MAERIVIIRPSALGDVCRTVPVLVSLRRAYPDARIDWLVQDTFAEAVAGHPDLSHVVPFPREALSRAAKSLRFGRVRAWTRSLREAKYDLVLDCQGLLRSGWIAWETRAAQRVGFADARELGWLGLTQRVRVAADTHTVERMMALVKALGVEQVMDLRLHVPPAAQARLLADSRLAGRYALLAPTSRWPSKLWPAERFAAIAESLLDGHVEHVVLTGMRSERGQIGPLLEFAASEPRVIDRVGATSVGELMALIKHAAIVIASDSAALHMAVGFERPLVGLFGPTRVGLVGPYRRERDVIQHVTSGDSFNHKRTTNAMMLRIGVEEVAAAAVDRLRTSRAR